MICLVVIAGFDSWAMQGCLSKFVMVQCCGKLVNSRESLIVVTSLFLCWRPMVLSHLTASLALKTHFLPGTMMILLKTGTQQGLATKEADFLEVQHQRGRPCAS